MGQAGSNHNPEMHHLRPGTYRIVSGLTGTAIQVSHHNNNKVVAWEVNNEKNQQWFVQSSGKGFRFKNCQHGSFLAVSSTDIHSVVYAGRFPTTWVLLKSHSCYLIQYADNNRVLDLHFGGGHNGNEIHIWPADGNGNKTWRFEHISDDTGEELPEGFRKEADRLKREIESKTQSLALKGEEVAQKERELAKKNQELTEMGNVLAQKDRAFAEQSALLSATIRQLEQDLKAKDEVFSQIPKTNEETSHLRKQQAHLQDELSQQQAETASLQGKMDRFEYLMAQMMSKDNQKLADIP